MSLARADLAALDATGQAELVRRGELTALELVDAAIARVERLNPRLNAVVSTCFERARDRARGGPSGPFAGVPYLLKDLIVEEEGLPFTEGSVWLRDHVSGFTSTLVTRLRAAGLVVLGRTNTPEFGMAPTCEPVLHGPTRNPWDLTRSTSGSSGGSAAAVASGMVPMAHGNDLGGSLRFPASACGLFGFKPTRGRQPLGPEYGDVVGGWGVEHALTVSVRDSAALLDATCGPAPGDPYPAPSAARPFAAEVGTDPGRLRIAFSPRTPGGGLGHLDCLAALDDAVALCVELGHELVEADLPGLDADRRPRDRGGVRRHDRLDRRLLDPTAGAATGTRGAGTVDPRLPGARSPGDCGGLPARRRGPAGLFPHRCRLPQPATTAWLTPTMSAPPPPLGEVVSTEQEPLRAAQRGGATVAYPAVVANITGGPAMSVPLWQTAAGLPVGVHFLGRVGADATLFRLAGQLERARPWTGRRPRVHAQAP